MPLPPPPGDLLAQIQKRGDHGATSTTTRNKKPAAAPHAGLLAALQARQPGASSNSSAAAAASLPKTTTAAVTETSPLPQTTTTTQQQLIPKGKLFQFDESLDAFVLDVSQTTPRLVMEDHTTVIVVVPLAPCVYRMTDYMLQRKSEPLARHRCLLKLGVLRCLERECAALNDLLAQRLNAGGPYTTTDDTTHDTNEKNNKNLPSLPALEKSTNNKNEGTTTRPAAGILEEEELGKTRFMELLSNCGVFQKVSELILQAFAAAAAAADPSSSNSIPHVRVDGLAEFLQELEARTPALQQARREIDQQETVSFFPGLGELFCPGSPLLCFPEGGIGELGCSVVQCWYVEDENKAQPGT